MTVVDFSTDTIAYAGFKSHWGLEGNVFTRQTEDLDMSSESDELDGSTWGARFENMLTGQQKAEQKISGVHTGVKGNIGDIMNTLRGRSTPVRGWAALESLNALSPIAFYPCRVKKYGVTSKRKEVVKFDAEINAAGDYNNGFILVSPKGTTQLATTGTGSDDDNSLNGPNGGVTTFGGVAQMHLYHIGGGTTPGVTVLVEHSPDGTTWATLATFVVATELTKDTTYVQRVRVASSLTVNNHVRAKWTTTGTPTAIQGLVMFSRGVDFDA